MATRFSVCFDCADPMALAAFWAEVLGYVVEPDSDSDFAAVVDPDGAGPGVDFQRVPEPKAGKSRLHLDLSCSDGPGAPPDVRRPQERAVVERLVTLGATEVGEVEEHGGVWIVMRDPEGNEFCVC